MREKKRREIITGWVDLLNGLVPHGGIVELPVLSGSMSPLIKPKSTIRIRSISAKDIHVGDIIVFREGNTLTTHRLLVRIPPWGRTFLYQKGDANRFGSWIRGSRVVGVVNAILDEAGACHDLSSPASKFGSGRDVRQQLVLTLWNTGLIVPRFIKTCLKRK
jgi:signal peptidase I